SRRTRAPAWRAAVPRCRQHEVPKSEGRGDAAMVRAHTGARGTRAAGPESRSRRSEEHTSELQSRFDLVCRLLLEKKKKSKKDTNPPPNKPTITTQTTTTTSTNTTDRVTQLPSQPSSLASTLTTNNHHHFRFLHTH